jgi:hypothetical protein
LQINLGEIVRYVSLDIETTGLNPDIHQVIEVGMIRSWDNTSLRLLIIQESYNCNPYCCNLHGDLWKEIQEVPHLKDVESRYDCGEALLPALFKTSDGWLPVKSKIYFTEEQEWACSPENISTMISSWYEGETLAGKNLASFDLKFLPKFKHPHRILDPGPMYVTKEDDKIPNLGECLKRAGMNPQVDHTALSDARAVIRVVEAALSS